MPSHIQYVILSHRIMNLQKNNWPIYHLVFPSQNLLASTMLRFQEYFESPRFKGKIFSLEEYKNWYIETNGDFTYYSDWIGFNIPSEVLIPFYDGKFNPLSEHERKLLELVSEIKQERFYLIATVEDANVEDTLHELLHGLFYLFPQYAKGAKETLKTFTKEVEIFEKFLRKKQGYCPEVFQDEIVAYLLDGDPKIINSLNVSENDLGAIREALHVVFFKHFKIDPLSIDILNSIQRIIVPTT